MSKHTAARRPGRATFELAAVACFALVTAKNGAVAIAEQLPGEPLFLRLPVSVRRGVLLGWGSAISAPWPMVVAAFVGVLRRPSGLFGRLTSGAVLGVLGLVGLGIEPNTYRAARPSAARRAAVRHVAACVVLIAASRTRFDDAGDGCTPVSQRS